MTTDLARWLTETVAEAYHGADGTNPHHDFAECGDPFCADARVKLDRVLGLRAAAEAYATHVQSLACDHSGAMAGTHTGCPEALALERVLRPANIGKSLASNTTNAHELGQVGGNGGQP